MIEQPVLPKPDDPQEVAVNRMQAMAESLSRKFDISEPNALALLLCAAAGMMMVYDRATSAKLLRALGVVMRKGDLATEADVKATDDAVAAFVLACAPIMGEA